MSGGSVRANHLSDVHRFAQATAVMWLCIADIIGDANFHTRDVHTSVRIHEWRKITVGLCLSCDTIQRSTSQASLVGASNPWNKVAEAPMTVCV